MDPVHLRCFGDEQHLGWFIRQLLISDMDFQFRIFESVKSEGEQTVRYQPLIRKGLPYRQHIQNLRQQTR